jgi:aminopeptidase N
VCSRYLGDARRQAVCGPVEEFLFAQLQTTRNDARRIEYFRAFADLAREKASLTRLKDLISGKLNIPGLTLRSRDRFRMLQTLLAADDADAPRIQHDLSTADSSNEGRRYAFASSAAVPDAKVKHALVTRFMDDPRLQEAWIEEALGPLNTLHHSSLTAPLLGPALAAIPKLKRERKIFFVNEWLGSFIGGQTSRASLQTVEQFLADTRLDPDLRIKVLEALDTLERTVRVRDKFTIR